jgi:hypothetical protein
MGIVLSFTEEDAGCDVLLTKPFDPDIDRAVDIDSVTRAEVELSRLVLKLPGSVGDMLVAVDTSLRVGDPVILWRLAVVETSAVGGCCTLGLELDVSLLIVAALPDDVTLYMSQITCHRLNPLHSGHRRSGFGMKRDG